MDFFPNKVESEHHFTVASDSSTIKLDAEALLPYHIATGRWYVKILHFSVSAYFENPGKFGKAFRIVSRNATSANNESLVLATTTRHELEESGGTVLFPNSRLIPLRHKTDRLVFEVETVDGKLLTSIPAGTQLLLGVALIQEG